MRIKCGNYDVVSSGLVISFKDEPIEFILSEGPPPFVIRFLFADDNGEQRIEVKEKSTSEGSITLFNFNNQFGSGSSDPMPVGTLSDRRLYLQYRVYSLGEKSARTFQYTWYLGENINQETRKDG